MEHNASTARSDLEQILVDETAEPKALPLSLLKDITGGFSDDWEIGCGGFAVVYKGILGDRMVAVKRLSKAYMHEKEFDREIECLMRVKHKNVIRFLGYCDDRQRNAEMYDGKLVMADVQQRLLCFEYIPKGSLDMYITDAYREWGTCYKIIKGICQGLQYLHENHIIHLDLKPTNILLDDNMLPKITDFGLSRCFEENQSRHITKNIVGTIGYLAPERGKGGEIGRRSDLYSLGVIIIEILTGQKGYQATEDVLQSWSDRLERSHRDTLCEQIRVCYEAALECIKFNPKERPVSAQDIIDRLHEMESIQDEIPYVPRSVPDYLNQKRIKKGMLLGSSSTGTSTKFKQVQKVVVKLDLHDDRQQKKALKTISGLRGAKAEGIDLMSVDMKDQKITVVGSMDPVDMVNKLRKFFPRAHIVSVNPAKKEKDGGDRKDGDNNQVELEYPPWYPSYNPQSNYYYVRSAEEDPKSCVMC